MIPKDLAAFRQLMRMAELGALTAGGVAEQQEVAIEYEGYADLLRALSTATPEQIMGIVGEVEARGPTYPFVVDPYYIVTPRSEDGA